MFERIKKSISAFKKAYSEKEELFFPYTFALVKLTDVAKMQGVDDNQNKEIILYQEGEIIKKYSYSKEMVETLKRQGIPVEHEQYDEEEEFEFDTISNFGSISIEKHE